jgi:pilus assembly protein Flp/PilA
MLSLRRLFSRSSERSAGQGLAEYALILALIAIVAIVALIFLGDNIAAILSSIGQQVGPPGGTP